jgi:hypothetical protein
MPYELFASLLGSFNEDTHFRDESRERLKSRLVAFGFEDPAAFWNELELTVHDHLALTHRSLELSASLQKAMGSEREAILKQIAGMNTCRSSAAALVAARAHFGGENFDRLLYTIVPPGTGWSLGMGTDEAYHAALLATGCQPDAAAKLVADSSTAAHPSPTPYWNHGVSPPKKSPWEWTDAERMVFRLDPNVVETQTPAGTGGWRSQRLNGSKNPEAIFPFELFGRVLSSESGVNPHPDHEEANARLFALGIKDPEAWWRELAPVLNPYTAPEREMHDVAARLQRADHAEREALDKQMAELRRAQCRSVSQGLTAAREHFGHETFDRILYMMVAPNLQLFKWVGNDLEKQLRYEARGCGSSTNSTLK